MMSGSDCSFTSNNSSSLSVNVIYCLRTIDLYHLIMYPLKTSYNTELGLAEHFNFVMTSEESKAEKPNREIFDMAMEKIQCSDPATAYHVGTSIDYDVSIFTSNLHRFILFCILSVLNFFYLKLTLHFIYYNIDFVCLLHFLPFYYITCLTLLFH